MLIVTFRAYETSAQESIVPIKDDRSLVKLRFVNGREPDLLVSQLAQEVSPDVIVGPILRDEVE